MPRLLGWDEGAHRRRGSPSCSRSSASTRTSTRGKYPRQLSGGEAQRVGVARALAADPPVLLMDEPFGAVDPLTRERLQAEFARIQRDLRKTVIFVTHDVDEAIRLADRIALMRDGRLQQYDTPEEPARPPGEQVRPRLHGRGPRAQAARTGAASPDVMRTDVPSVADGADETALVERGVPSESASSTSSGARGRLEGWFDCRAVRRGPPDDAVTARGLARGVGAPGRLAEGGAVADARAGLPLDPRHRRGAAGCSATCRFADIEAAMAGARRGSARPATAGRGADGAVTAAEEPER